ncbi:hypothetical protein KFK09_015644 [Dendrobium nobile]|uniref:Uncharacterized protein n=1 Tax=Dendrobium nobile TaxID=94219 RepID=A0A8T3B6K4_DENNO|nr:hypothetical protein KFK09_015644 [Dendrobium nobile]
MVDLHQVVHCNVNVCNVNCFASFVYAASNRIDRINLWDQIVNFGININGPWCIGGDFNIISNASERNGGCRPNIKAMEEFNAMINECNLQDIGFLGSPFTWNRGSLCQRFLNMWLLHDNFKDVITCNWNAPVFPDNNIADMNGDATAGPDGFTTKFFQKSWEIVKGDVINAVQDFFGGTLTSGAKFGERYVIFLFVWSFFFIVDFLAGERS